MIFTYYFSIYYQDYKITYKEASPSTTYFRVVAGSYSNRANAEALEITKNDNAL